MSQGKVGAERPLSPHLQIYRPMLTMLMSIAHRITGVANAVGFALLAWWLIALAAGPQQYWAVERFFASVPGRLVLFLFSWALIHHMLGGIRHLIWDTGTALDKKSIEILAWTTLIGGFVLNVALWVFGYWAREGF
jgi:succinate dehydrogenase / fumarate reductase, cytochrome b subunit